MAFVKKKKKEEVWRLPYMFVNDRFHHVLIKKLCGS